jgi:O-antigen ligase
MILSISLSIDLDKRKYLLLIQYFILTYTISALSIVFVYSSGFYIHEVYLPIPKNQISPAFGVAFLLTCFLGFYHRGNKQLIYLIPAILLIGSLLVIRGRATILGVCITLLIFFIFFMRTKKERIYTIFLLGIFVFFLRNQIYDSFFLNYTPSDIESVSAGRVSVYAAGYEYLKDNPILGQLQRERFFGGTIHNYILFTLFNYGLVLGLPLIIVYFNYLMVAFKGVIKNTYLHLDAGPLVMVMLFVVSVFEYTYPFSPGSAVFFPLFLFGQYLRSKVCKCPV